MEPQLGVTESNLFSSAKERQGSGAGRGCAIVSAAFQRLKYRLVLVRACPILRDAHELELIPPKKRLNNCCLGLFEGGREGIRSWKNKFRNPLDELCRERSTLESFFPLFYSFLFSLSLTFERKNSRGTDEWIRLFVIPQEDNKEGGRY